MVRGKDAEHMFSIFSNFLSHLEILQLTFAVQCSYTVQYVRVCTVRKCAAKAFYSCPAIISQRLESRIISKEPQENTEEESRIIQARSHITLEKSSINYKPSEE